MKNDQINQSILRELRQDGRLTNIELAEKVGLSPSACLRRVQELERSGVIAGYRAVLDRKAMGAGFVVYVTVGLARHLKKDQQAFENAMNRARQVVECHNITGTVEYLLRVETEDLEAYKVFHTDVLGTVEQVASITSFIVMGTPKDERG
nr:Lrp/AsnC family transcriptional regulator [Hirschia maritima]